MSASLRKNFLGRTDIKVTNICLGTMTWGEQNNQDEAFAQMDYAIEQGINFFDTAEMYPVPPKPDTQGSTETIIGNWLAARGGRNNIVLASKIVGPADWMSHIRGGSRHTKQHIDQAIDTSLERLQTDYIDLYQLHWPDRSTNYFGQLGYDHEQTEQLTPIQETLEALAPHVQAGRIRCIGLSNETPWGVMEFARLAEQMDLPRVVSVQNPYNLLNRTFEVGLAEIAHREDIGLLAYSPLAFGVLSGKYLNDQWPAGARITLFKRFSRYLGEAAEQATQAYVSLAEQHNLDPAQMALAFVNSRSFLTSNIIGATNIEQLKSNISSATLTLSDDVLSGIEDIHQRHSNPCP